MLPFVAKTVYTLLIIITYFYRSKRWVINCRREDLLQKNVDYLMNNCCLCTIHFETSQYMNEKRERLVFNAVPTLFKSVPNPPKPVTNKRKCQADRRRTEIPVKKRKSTPPSCSEVQGQGKQNRFLLVLPEYTCLFIRVVIYIFESCCLSITNLISKR